MTEQACESFNTCNNDQVSFKAYFSSWLAATSLLAPFTLPTVSGYLAPSAKAAAAQCDAGTSGSQCGFKWTVGASNDGNFGIGQSMSALGVIQSSVVAVPVKAGAAPDVVAPVTNSTGGTSIGDPEAGITKPDSDGAMLMDTAPITLKDKVAASFVTVAVLGSVIGGSLIMVLES